MTRDDIIRMAREADDFADKHTPPFSTVPNEWQEIRDRRFAALVAAAEREACAALCDEMEASPALSDIEKYRARFIGDAIRARGDSSSQEGSA